MCKVQNHHFRRLPLVGGNFVDVAEVQSLNVAASMAIILAEVSSPVRFSGDVPESWMNPGCQADALPIQGNLQEVAPRNLELESGQGPLKCRSARMSGSLTQQGCLQSNHKACMPLWPSFPDRVGWKWTISMHGGRTARLKRSRHHCICCSSGQIPGGCCQAAARSDCGLRGSRQAAF